MEVEDILPSRCPSPSDSWDGNIAFDSASDKGWTSGSEHSGNEEPSAHETTVTPPDEDQGDPESQHNASPESGAEASPGSGFDFTTAGSALDITKYIPLGCLRIRRTHWAVSFESWMTCKKQWNAFNHPKDRPNSLTGNYLSPFFQGNLFQEPDLVAFRALHDAAWIRMEFKSCHKKWGIIRIYVLPDDVGRAEIDRSQPSLRKALISLLELINVTKSAWNGQWCEADPQVTVYSSRDKDSEAPSLFELFNTLPSPVPQPDMVTDDYVRDAMYRISSGELEGLSKSTKLFAYQMETASLMLEREVAPQQLLDPRLTKMIDQNNREWYCDLSLGLCFREPRLYEAARGGICAETMGLGKTLICLTVILATKELSSKTPSDILDPIPSRKKTASLLDMAAATIGRTGTPWKKWLCEMESGGFELKRICQALDKNPGFYMLHPPPPRRVSRNPIIPAPRKIYLSTTTLVVVPPNLVQQWLQQIAKHTEPGSLKTLLMDDWKKDLPEVHELIQYDIVLFSKPRFEYEARDETTPVDEDGTTRMGRDNIKRWGKENVAYHSPLKDIHFKRLVIDEGHAFGNASKASKTEAVTVVDFLNLSSRWIISGTPTRGLYGLEGASAKSRKLAKPTKSVSDIPEFAAIFTSSTISASPTHGMTKAQREKFYAQERKDIEKLGNIAKNYLKIRPWANSEGDEDSASWSQYVMQPRHGSKSQGNVNCLQTTLEGMILRHRPEDVLKDVSLPPLHHDFVFLDGSLQNKLSLNTFAMMIASNAVTSERKDVDYFFHPRQRKNLLQLVSNMRQGSFFWSGFETEHIRATVEIGKNFLREKKVAVTQQDELLLLEAIKLGEEVLSNPIASLIFRSHEMPIYIENEWNEDVRRAWALDGDAASPTLMGATLVHNSQKLVGSQLWKTDPMEGLVEAGLKAINAAFESNEPKVAMKPMTPKQRDALKRKKAAEAPELAGGVTIGDGSSPRKKTKTSLSASKEPFLNASLLLHTMSTLFEPADKTASHGNEPSRADALFKTTNSPRSILKQSSTRDVIGTLPSDSPISTALIISTASVKLSYLMDKIVAYHESEKIIVFYENDNVAYYIAQALECLGIKHLIYAKSLQSARRSKYVATFNQTPTFRVLLMDVSQAAFGLDISSASRVFFVNPVFSPQVEAQAIKRAHRIGQTRPVFVETLVLKGSIEEVILERRKDMSEQEHNKCKSILDDETMYDWIKNVRFLPMGDVNISGPEQMAKLKTPQKVFSERVFGGRIVDPDADLIGDEMPKKWKGKAKAKTEGKGKRKAKVAFADAPAEDQGPSRTVRFALVSEHGNSEGSGSSQL